MAYQIRTRVDRSSPAPTSRLPFASACLVTACFLSSTASAGDPDFTPPQFLPGDLTIGLAVGQQEEMEIAAGGGGSLAVWSDMRSSLDEFQGLAGSGFDIYGALLDDSGNVTGSFMINEGPGNQSLPHVAWNGSNWLVAWIESQVEGPPYYERICGVRVAPDGTLLDPTPIVIHEETWGCYCNYFGLAMAGGGADGWVVVLHAPPKGVQAIPQGVVAVRVQADGTVANPGGLLVHLGLSQWTFDIAFAQDEYMIVYSDGSTTKARRYSPTLQYLGSTTIPFAREVATDGTNFLVIGQSSSSWPPKLEAMLLGHYGGVLVNRFTVATGDAVTGPNGERVGFGGNNYWVAWTPNKFARVTPAGQLLDPEGFTIDSVTGTFGWEPAFDTVAGGGIQIVWRDGGGGAGYPRDVYTAQITPAGQPVNQTAISVNAPAQVEPEFAVGAGVNMVVFRSRSSGAARILAQRLDDNGVVLDPEPIEVASGPVQWLTTPSIDLPQVAWNGSVFMVVWSDTIDILARRMNPDGTFVDASPLVIMPGQGAGVGALGANFLVAGSTVGTLLAPGALRVSRVDGVTGAVLDHSPIKLSGAGLTGHYPHIVTLGGRWLVVWESVYKDPWSTTVLISTATAFVQADGTTTWGLGVNLSERPNVAIAGDRALLVAVDDTVPGGATDMEAQILMADGTVLGPAFQVSTAFDEQLRPAATWTGTEFLVAWEDKRNSVVHFDERTDIYGTRVTADGVVLDPDGIPFAAGPLTEIQPQFMTVGGTTFMAVSTLKSDDPALSAFRLGIHRTNGEHCQPDLGFGGPGTSSLTVCGDVLVPGAGADVHLTGAPPNAPAGFCFATGQGALPLLGGTLVPVPLLGVVALATDSQGEILIPGLSSSAGPFSLYVQVIVFDALQPQGFQFSNAVEIQFLP